MADNNLPNEAIAQLEEWVERQAARVEEARRSIRSLKALFAATESEPAASLTTSRAPDRPHPTRKYPLPAARGAIRKTPEGKYIVHRGVQSYAQVAADYFGEREFDEKDGWHELGPHIEGYNPNDRKQADSFRRSLGKLTSPFEPVPGKPGWYRRKGAPADGGEGVAE